MTLHRGGAQFNMANGVREFAHSMPNQIAVIDGPRKLTYRDLGDRACRVAQALLASGISPGDRVAVLLGNRMEFFEIAAGIAMGGMTIVPINTRSINADIEYIVDQSACAALIVDEKYLALTEGIRASVKVVWTIDGSTAGWDYESILSASRAEDPMIEIDENDTFMIMFTSGTTGKPKGVLLSHRGRALTCISTALDYGIGPGRRTMAVAPMYHGAGFTFAYAAVFCGATVSVLRHWDPAEFLAMARRDRIQTVFMIPTHAQTLRALKKGPQQYDLSHLETIYFNAAALPKVLKEWVIATFPQVGVFELYGSTEASVVTVLRPQDALRKIGSVGHAWFMTEIRVVGDDGNLVKPGEPGELFARSPYLMTGYLDDLESTEDCTTSDGFVTAGDIVTLDDEGYIYIVDRKKDMIVTGGVNVFPREIEEIVAAFPGVHEVAVVGLPDEKWGECIVAVVVPRAGIELDFASLQEFVEPKLARYKQPRRWEISESLPRNAGGKVVKREVISRVTSGH
jgi:acyl-CoA synthetase (AMP-forming)/AMP-acid ligase II